MLRRAALWAAVALLGHGALVPAGAKLRVVATVADLGSLAREVGGDRVEVWSITKGYQDPHYVEPRPSYARRLRRADLLLYVGLELEAAWLPPLLETARNPKLRPGSLHLLEAASAVDTILEVPTGPVSRAQGDIHPLGNPHVLLDPRNGLAVAEAIAERLARLDPDGEEVYRSRLEAFRNRMTERIRQWEAQAAGLRGQPVVAYHKQWEYLERWLGFRVLDYVENRPGIPPSPRHVRDLVETMKEEGVAMVLAATFVDTEAAGEVARRAGAHLVVLPAGVGAVEGTETYEALFETIVRRLLDGIG
jgi:zinc/manganese transport system substrate-binding protein